MTLGSLSDSLAIDDISGSAPGLRKTWNHGWKRGFSGQKIIQASDMLSYIDASFSLAGPLILFLFERSSVSGFRTGSRCPVPYTPRPEHST
jgi:hypothetical protein